MKITHWSPNNCKCLFPTTVTTDGNGNEFQSLVGGMYGVRRCLVHAKHPATDDELFTLLWKLQTELDAGEKVDGV